MEWTATKRETKGSSQHGKILGIGNIMEYPGNPTLRLIISLGCSPMYPLPSFKKDPILAKDPQSLKGRGNKWIPNRQHGDLQKKNISFFHPATGENLGVYGLLQVTLSPAPGLRFPICVQCHHHWLDRHSPPIPDPQDEVQRLKWWKKTGFDVKNNVLKLIVP